MNRINPNEVLAALRTLTATGPDADPLGALDMLRERFRALDAELSHGGPLPSAWARPTTADSVNVFLRTFKGNTPHDEPLFENVPQSDAAAACLVVQQHLTGGAELCYVTAESESV